MQSRRGDSLGRETRSLPAWRGGGRGGMGMRCSTRRFATGEGLPTVTGDALPALPEIESVLVRRNHLSDAAADLADLLASSAGA